MTSDQYRAGLTQLELTQVGFAALLGLHDVTTRRWARFGVSGPPAILLQLMVDAKITPADIEQARIATHTASKRRKHK
jgi:hypothetical protein